MVMVPIVDACFFHSSHSRPGDLCRHVLVLVVILALSTAFANLNWKFLANGCYLQIRVQLALQFLEKKLNKTVTILDAGSQDVLQICKSFSNGSLVQLQFELNCCIIWEKIPCKLFYHNYKTILDADSQWFS